MTVGAEGVASGVPLMVGSKLLQGWLTASQVPLGLIGLLGLAELPYTLKLFWAPLLDRWPIAWPDRRRGWMLVLQVLLALGIAAMALLHPSRASGSLTLVGLAAVLLAVVSATQDIVVGASDLSRRLGQAVLVYTLLQGCFDVSMLHWPLLQVLTATGVAALTAGDGSAPAVDPGSSVPSPRT